MATPALVKVLTALSADPATRPRFVGGCVRNWLLDVPVTDIDIATPLVPDRIIAMAAAAGLKPVPTGIDHGTVTVVSDGQGIEVTTLRRDVSTDGRRATVAFTDRWLDDARRRDLTINALYADAAGTVTDFVGGLADLAVGRVRFVGDPATRLTEDMLRVLRFYRFHASYGTGEPAAGIAQLALQRRDLIDRLSGERIAKEMLRLLTAPGAVSAVAVMAETGLLPALIPGADASGARRLGRLVDLTPAVDDPIVRLSALLPIGGAAAAIERLRLSRKQAATVDAVSDPARLAGYPPQDARAARTAVYRDGAVLATALAASAAARLETAAAATAWSQSEPTLATFTPPRFPISAKDLLAQGYTPGPTLGQRLRALEAAWLAADMPPHWTPPADGEGPIP